MAGSQQTGTVDLPMREGDRGRLQSQPQAKTGVHGRAEAQRQVGTWCCMLMLLYWLCSKVRHRRETWEGKNQNRGQRRDRENQLKGRLFRGKAEKAHSQKRR